MLGFARAIANRSALWGSIALFITNLKVWVGFLASNLHTTPLRIGIDVSNLLSASGFLASICSFKSSISSWIYLTLSISEDGMYGLLRLNLSAIFLPTFICLANSSSLLSFISPTFGIGELSSPISSSFDVKTTPNLAPISFEGTTFWIRLINGAAEGTKQLIVRDFNRLNMGKGASINILVEIPCLNGE